MKLNLIYHFRSSENLEGEFRGARYRVVYFFSEQGFIDLHQLRELSKTVPDADHVQLTFLSLDDLKVFALRVAEELAASEVRLVSVQDYNIGLDGARDLAGLQSIFQQYGELVVNEARRTKKGLFSKLFS